jgi:thymidylate synthase
MYNLHQSRVSDTQYRDNLKLILKKGKQVGSRQGKKCLRYIAPPPMHFRLSNGFPLITERSLEANWWKGIGELCAFINGVRTLAGLQGYGVSWWKQWATLDKCTKRGLPEGDLGPGSYGAAFHDFPTGDGNTLNQYQHLLEQIIDEPELRTHFVSPWIPQFNMRGQGKVHGAVVSPCHGWVHVFSDEDRKMTLHMFQRSADFPVGVPFNMVQYAALLMMIARATDYEPYEVIFSYSDAHIYEDQIPHVEKMLRRAPRRLPTVRMRPEEDFFAYRGENFTLADYKAHPAINDMPVAT